MPARTLANRPSSKTSMSPSAKSCAGQPQSRAVLYARVSSKDQEKEGFSIPAQQRLVREYALEKDLAIAQEFIDVETAKQSGRAGFAEMLAYLKKHACRTILVEKTDRFYRKLKDWSTLDKLGVTIHLTPTGTLTVVHSFCESFYPCPDGAFPSAGVVQVANGDF
jgi:hypothetical protein